MSTSFVGRRAWGRSGKSHGPLQGVEFGTADRDESRRVVTWFAVLLALPLAVFGIFAALLIGADYAVTRTHELATATQEIVRLDGVMQRAIEQRADTTIADVRTAATDRDAIGQIRLASYSDEAIVLVNHGDQRVFPPTGTATQAEQMMLQRFSAAIAAARSEMKAHGNLPQTATAFWTADISGCRSSAVCASATTRLKSASCSTKTRSIPSSKLRSTLPPPI